MCPAARSAPGYAGLFDPGGYPGQRDGDKPPVKNGDGLIASPGFRAPTPGRLPRVTPKLAAASRCDDTLSATRPAHPKRNRSGYVIPERSLTLRSVYPQSPPYEAPDRGAARRTGRSGARRDVAEATVEATRRRPGRPWAATLGAQQGSSPAASRRFERSCGISLCGAAPGRSELAAARSGASYGGD